MIAQTKRLLLLLRHYIWSCLRCGSECNALTNPKRSWKRKQQEKTSIMSKKRKRESSMPSSNNKKHASWVFPVSSYVHPCSAGSRPKHLAALDPWVAQDFSILETVGHGAFGQVYRAIYNHNEPSLLGSSSKVVALKRVSKPYLVHTDRVDIVRTEINVHSQ